MALFANKKIKSLFILFLLILFLFMAAGQILSITAATAYKQSMISHDYAVAGILAQENVDSAVIQKAFFLSNHQEAYLTGKKLLESSGYENKLPIHLLNDTNRLYRKNAFSLFILSLLTSAAIFLCLLLYFMKQENIIKKAVDAIDSFMNGNTDISLNQNEEGSFSRLFNSIQSLATSLNTHIIKEKHNKEFLKDTIANISHQLKTPLAALRMYNEILQAERTENEVVTNFLIKTDRELNRMENLIMNLLKLAKLDADSIVLNSTDKKLKNFMEELIRDFRTRAESENKQLILDCDKDITLYYDEVWLYEAVSNIIKNAFDHTKARDTITVTCQETPTLKEITIRDNGFGIHPEDIHSIFKRFYRSRFSNDKQGVGIGLTLSKMIVEKHGGSITVESELGKGAVFSIVFPKLTNM